MGYANRARPAVILIALALIAGCARAVTVGSEPGPVYRIQVINSLDHDMIVSYDAGGGPAVLGTVRAGRSEHFVITSRATTSINVTARDAAGSHTVGPYAVQLEAGATPEVTLR